MPKERGLIGEYSMISERSPKSRVVVYFKSRKEGLVHCFRAEMEIESFWDVSITKDHWNTSIIADFNPTISTTVRQEILAGDVEKSECALLDGCRSNEADAIEVYEHCYMERAIEQHARLYSLKASKDFCRKKAPYGYKA